MKMDRVTLTIWYVLVCAGQALGVAPIGPASSDIEKGQFTVSFDYSQGEVDLVGAMLGIELEAESEFDSYLGKVSFGVEDGLELFGRFGGAEIDGSSGIAYGLGVKARLAASEDIDWGFAVQITSGGYEDDGTLPELGALYHEETDYYAVQVAAGPVFKGKGFRFYGGPILYWLEGDGDVDLIGGPLPGRFYFELEKELDVGGYVGLTIGVFDSEQEDESARWQLNVEYQIGDGWGLLGLGLGLRY